MVEEAIVFPIHSMYEVGGGTPKIIARWAMLHDCRAGAGTSTACRLDLQRSNAWILR
jgi:hypothetical protein